MKATFIWFSTIIDDIKGKSVSNDLFIVRFILAIYIKVASTFTINGNMECLLARCVFDFSFQKNLQEH